MLASAECWLWPLAEGEQSAEIMSGAWAGPTLSHRSVDETPSSPSQGPGETASVTV